MCPIANQFMNNNKYVVRFMLRMQPPVGIDDDDEYVINKFARKKFSANSAQAHTTVQ